MFLENDRVEIIYCPDMPYLKGVKAVCVRNELYMPANDAKEFDSDSDFVPNNWEVFNAFWSVKVIEGVFTGRVVKAFVRHLVKPGDEILVMKAEIGWKELEGRRFRVENVKGSDYAIRTARGISVAVKDIRPLRMPEHEEPELTKEKIAQVALEVLDVNDLQDSPFTHLFDKLGISLADHASVTAETNVDLSVTLEVTYGKGVEVGDETAVVEALAKKLQGMTESELIDYLTTAVDQAYII